MVPANCRECEHYSRLDIPQLGIRGACCAEKTRRNWLSVLAKRSFSYPDVAVPDEGRPDDCPLAKEVTK